MSNFFAVANNRISHRSNPVSIGLSLGLLVTLCAPAFAQNTMDQDSLLPPEVVPLDPTAASKMTQSQAQYRAANMTPSAPSSQSSSGFGSQSLGQGPDGQSAQEFRNQAFNSLYNQGTLAPPQTASQAPWNAMQQSQQQMMNQQPNMQGQQPNMAMGASNGQVSQSGWMNANGAPQQQTLSGGVQQPQKTGSGTLSGAARVLGTAAGLGGGLMVGALMMRNYNSMGAGMLGTSLLGGSMLNYGLRNSFRGF